MPPPQPSISQKQLEANRTNAARSTGPRTPQGKARSAQNVRKHAFTASTFAIERLALTQQALLRAARLETGLFTTCLIEARDPSGDPLVFMAEELAGAGDIEITRAQNRSYRCAVEEFDRLKALRQELPNEAIFDAQPEPKKTTCTP